ncbi:MAG: four helix bundle protein [Acidobacteriota bacterium]|nr:four helix bundle protein [Acidobacteriota bacterium]
MGNSYRDLIVWQKAKALAIFVYRITEEFPKQEIFGLTAQMRRSAVSIPSNIAEGQGRNSKTDFMRFLCIARGSLLELATQIEIALELQLGNQEGLTGLMKQCDEVRY